MRRDAGICSLRVHFICVFLPFLFLWYVLISTFYFFASFHWIFVILDLYWRGMILQPSYDAKYLFFYLQNVFIIIFFVHFQEKCIILMHCLYESINKHNAVLTFLVHTCVSSVLRPKPKKSVKNWWRNNTSKFGLKTQKNVNNFQNTWNFENSIQTKMS